MQRLQKTNVGIRLILKVTFYMDILNCTPLIDVNLGFFDRGIIMEEDDWVTWVAQYNSNSFNIFKNPLLSIYS